jgi:protein TonB
VGWTAAVSGRALQFNYFKPEISASLARQDPSSKMPGLDRLVARYSSCCVIRHVIHAHFMNYPAATHSPDLPWPSTRQDRALAWCVGLSLLLHLGVLVALPGWHQHLKPAVQTVFSASFAPPPAAGPMTPQPPHPAQPKVKAQPPEPPKPVPRPAPQPMAQPVMPALPAPAPTATPSASAPLATPVMTAPAATSNAASVNVPAAAAAVAPAVAPAPPSSPTPQPGSVSSAATSTAANSNEAGTIEQYRLALIGVARKFKRYPTQAMDRGWTGRVDVRLTIGSNGQMQDVVVRRSSGYGTLDNAALDMVRKGAPLTPLPPALRGREVVIDIPVIFDLQAG